jgi:hypothetical protein
VNRKWCQDRWYGFVADYITANSKRESQECNADWLTNPVFDPFTQTAEYKACAVAVEKI